MPGESQIAVMTRVVYEALADLVNSTDDPGYASRLNMHQGKQAIKQWRKVGEFAATWGDETLRQYAASRVASLGKTVDELEKSGVKGSVTVKEKFTKARMPSGFHEMYEMLCGPAHNDIYSLLERFSDKGSPALGRPLADPTLIDLLSLNAHAALETLPRIPKFANADSNKLAIEIESANDSFAHLVDVKQRVSTELQRAATE